MKMKEICEKTGLTERAVRLYCERGLLSPDTYTQNEREYLVFSERDEKALHNRLEVVRFEKSNDTLPVFVEERFNVIKRKFARIVRKSVIQYDKKWNDYKRKQK